MLRASVEAAVKSSTNVLVLKEALERINDKLLEYEDNKNYIYSEDAYIKYANLLSLQREAKIKVRKYSKPRF